MSNQMPRLAICLLFLLGYVTAVSAKRVDDVVVLKNGDRLTGEIKSLSRGELRFKASYMAESVRLDWSKVDRLESKDQYQIYLIDGQLFTNSFELNHWRGESDENFTIGLQQNVMKVNQMMVLRILPVEGTFWRQLEGSIDLGFSFTSGNDQYQTTLATTTTYRTGDHSFTAAIDSAFSGQTQGSRSARNQFTFDYRKQLSPKWYVGGLFDVLRSDQQSLDRRISVGGFIGRNIIQREDTRLSVFGGVAGTREKYFESIGQPETTNADAVLGFDFATFRFSKTDIRSRLASFPSLTTPGRIRLQATSDVSFKIVKDLWWGFHLYENFDSKPPILANKNDLGVSTTLGWKF